MKYRKKPISISATQWFANGDHPEDFSVPIVGSDHLIFLSEGKVVRRFRRPDEAGSNNCKHCGNIMHLHGWIDTLEGGHIVCPGDFIITGIHNEKYPVKPNIFALTYEKVEE